MALPGQKTFLECQSEIADELEDIQDLTLLVRPSLATLKRIGNDAHRQICAAWNWAWLYRELTFNTVAGQQTPYAMDSTAEDVFWMTIPSVPTSLTWMSETEWRKSTPGAFSNVQSSVPFAYIPAPVSANSGPLRFYIFPAGTQAYAVTYGAKLRVANLVADADYPNIPAQWQHVWLSLWKAKVLEYLGADSSEPRYRRYMKQYSNPTPGPGEEVGGMQLMWLADQRSAEAVWRFRSRLQEAGLSYPISAQQMFWDGMLQ